MWLISLLWLTVSKAFVMSRCSLMRLVGAKAILLYNINYDKQKKQTFNSSNKWINVATLPCGAFQLLPRVEHTATNHPPAQSTICTCRLSLISGRVLDNRDNVKDFCLLPSSSSGGLFSVCWLVLVVAPRSPLPIQIGSAPGHSPRPRFRGHLPTNRRVFLPCYFPICCAL